MELLTALSTVFIAAIILGRLAAKIKLPPLLAMLFIGVVLGPYVLDVLSPSLLNISADLRQLALVVILLRAGLSLDIADLKKNGKSAVLLCFLPATAEIAGYMLLGSLLLKLDLIDAALLGCVMAAVSPAVVVPRMLKLTDEGYGADKGIPQMITAGASADDVVVITLFGVLSTMAAGNSFSFNILWQIPVSIFLGVVVGILSGIVISKIFSRFSIYDAVKVLILLNVSFLFIALEHLAAEVLSYAALLSVICMAAVLFINKPDTAKRLSGKFSELWIAAEILLFVLVGAAVDISYAASFAGTLIAVISSALIFRAIGTYTCLIGSKLNQKERLFCVIAYSPKATVQAAIGAIPLSLGLAAGQIILSAAVLAVILTAPLGALLIDLTYKKLLTKSDRKTDYLSVDI